MTDYTELKLAADAVSSADEWYSNKTISAFPEYENDADFVIAASPAAVLALITDNESTNARLHEVSVACATSEQERDQLKFEKERQAAQFKEWQAGHHANYVKVAKERDQLLDEIEQLHRAEKNDAIAYNAAIQRQNELRAEVAGLRTGYEAYELVNAELKAENETLVAAAQSLRDEWRKDQTDAERYRMVRGIASISASRRHLVVKRRPVNGFSSSTARDFDASIDAALAQGEQS